jgi:outer membrane protein assembly factor BamB
MLPIILELRLPRLHSPCIPVPISPIRYFSDGQSRQIPQIFGLITYSNSGNSRAQMDTRQSNGMPAQAFPAWYRADLALVLSNSLVAAVLAAFGLAFLFGPLASPRWPWPQLGLILHILPAPDLVPSLISISPGSSASSYFLAGIIDLLLAGFMVALAVGIGKSQRWAYWTYSLVCLSAILSRVLGIWRFLAPNRFAFMPAAGRYVLLDSAGIIIALAAAWYSYIRASSSPAPQAGASETSARLPGSVPWATVVFTVLVLLFIVLRSVYLFHWIDRGELRYEVFRFVLTVLAYASILVLGCLRSMRSHAASLALGISVMTLVTFILQAGATSASLGMLVLWIAVAGSRQGAGLAQAAFVLGNLVLVFVSSLSLIRRRNLHAGFAALAAIFVGSVDPVVHALKEHDAHLYSLAHELARGGPYILFRTESCLLRFKAEHRGAGFPDSLRQLDKILPGCLQDGLARGGEIGGYRIEYQVSATTPIEHFSLIASPSVHYTGSMVSFFSDETGILRTYSGNRLAVASDGGVTPAEDLLRIRNCVVNFTSLSDRQNTGWSEANRAYDADQMHYPLSFDEMAAEKRCSVPGLRDAGSWKTSAYRFSYRRVVNNGVENFALLARPIQYGSSGLRSYFVDNTSVIHATAENRDATADDPWAYRCEFTSLGTPCVDQRAKTRAASEDDLPNEDLRYAPEQRRSHAGGLASTDSAQLFWRFNKPYIWFAGVSSDLQRVFMRVADKGVIALSREGNPLWIFEGAQSHLAVEDSIYVINEDGILSRVDANGKILWSFNYFFRGVPVRSSEGIIYAFAGSGLYAITEGGEMLWRMQLPDHGGSGGVLSENQKVLYVVSDRKLHAVDIRKGKLLWSADNACYSAADLCLPQLLLNGSIVIPSDEVNGTKLRNILRLFDSLGKTLWTIKYPGTIEYLVPTHTNSIIVGSQGGLQAVNAQGVPEWNLPKAGTLNESHRAGFFYACINGLQSVVDMQGQHRLVDPAENPWAGLCGPVHEASNDLLFIEERPSTLWTIRLSDLSSRPLRSAR